MSTLHARSVTAIGIGLFALSLLGGCAESKSGLSLGDLEHVHSVATDGEQFFLASHHGLYVLSGGSWDLRGEEMDLMGFSISEGIFYGSGHPGPGQNLPNPLRNSRRAKRQLKVKLGIFRNHFIRNNLSIG